MKVIFFCRDFNWEMMLSSVIFELAKFLPASTNVGRLPGKFKVKYIFKINSKYKFVIDDWIAYAQGSNL